MAEREGGGYALTELCSLEQIQEGEVRTLDLGVAQRSSCTR